MNPDNLEVQSGDDTHEIGRYRIKKGQPLILGGRQFITINALAELFGLDHSTIRSAVERDGLKYALGVTKGGHGYYLYDPEEVRLSLKPYLELPRESKRRTLMVDRKTHRTINSFVHLFRSEEISYDKVQAVISERNIPAVPGIDRCGHIVDFYSVRKVREALADFLSLPVEGGRSKTRRDLAKAFGVSADKIEATVGEELESKRGRNPHNGTEEVFYDVGMVGDKLSSYLALPQADKQGVIEIEGRRFMLLTELARVLSTTRYKVGVAIDKHGIKAEKGKDFLGRERDFFDIEMIREKIVDLLRLDR